MSIVHAAMTYQVVIDRCCQLVSQPHRMVVTCPHGQKRAKHVGAPIAVVLWKATYACYYKGWHFHLATGIAAKVLLSAHLGLAVKVERLGFTAYMKEVLTLYTIA